MIKLGRLSGKRAHQWQRYSAYYLLAYFPYLGWQTLQFPSYPDLQTLLQNQFQGFFAFVTLLAAVLTLIHLWIGGRDILIDYAPRKKTESWLGIYQIVLFLIVFDLIWILYASLT
ncbi:succinate dehydrogenase, hydrophobic membrane anchor protein [Thiomicrorhabdus sp.]|uniref:succinate dehydrogenase, hydrophobic membrane anchor protein n=1 Tax=Thiomicrorhabdus sp. TaxID=2039724 RepID=UPI0029C6070E|nr:succinate dehydrogenase, hydrophobic membrane anchor protein [Thiomicrorhabdus sp.]